MKNEIFAKAIKEIGHYSDKAVELIADRFSDLIEETPEEDAKSLAKCIYEMSNEYSSEAEALDACAEDSELTRHDRVADRDYLEEAYDVEESDGVFMLFQKAHA